MKLRQSNIAVVGFIMALMAMVVSLYMPHHHHKEAICIGSYDCEGEAHHAHKDACGGEGAEYACFLNGVYIDARHLNHAQSDFSFKCYDHLVAIIDGWINGSFYDYKQFQQPAFLPERWVAPVLRLKALRGPPGVR